MPVVVWLDANVSVLVLVAEVVAVLVIDVVGVVRVQPRNSCET